MRLRLALVALVLALPAVVAEDAVTESRRYAGPGASRFTSPPYVVDDCAFQVNVNPVCFQLPAGTTLVDAALVDDTGLTVMGTVSFYNAAGNVIPNASASFCDRVVDVPVPENAARAYIFVLTLPANPSCAPATTVTSTLGTATLTMRSP